MKGIGLKMSYLNSVDGKRKCKGGAQVFFRITHHGACWELEADQHIRVGKRAHNFFNKLISKIFLRFTRCRFFI